MQRVRPAGRAHPQGTGSHPQPASISIAAEGWLGLILSPSMSYQQAIARIEDILGGPVQKPVPTQPPVDQTEQSFSAQLQKAQAAQVSPQGFVPAAAYTLPEPVQNGQLNKQLFEPRRQAAQAIANRFGLQVTSSYRTPEHNAEVGGVPNSLHTRGLGFDLTGSQAQMNKAKAWAESHPEIFQEVLVHDVGSGLHLHLGFKASK